MEILLPTFELHIVIRKIFAAFGQLVVLEGGQQVFQLEEEAFAGFVVVGVHVEGC